MKRMIGECLLLCGTLAEKKQERPNVVLFVTDHVSPDDIGCYGNTDVITRNINIRGEPVDKKYNAIRNNIKERF